MPSILVKKASETVLDVFTGKGWSNWSRFDLIHEKGRPILKLIKGKPMSKEDFKQLYSEVCK
jgi:hypothetical protein